MLGEGAGAAKAPAQAMGVARRGNLSFGPARFLGTSAPSPQISAVGSAPASLRRAHASVVRQHDRPRRRGLGPASARSRIGQGVGPGLGVPCRRRHRRGPLVHGEGVGFRRRSRPDQGLVQKSISASGARIILHKFSSRRRRGRAGQAERRRTLSATPSSRSRVEGVKDDAGT